jgi:LiaF transmembrane domain
MHVRRGYLGWGVFLILTGAIPLLVRSGYLTVDQVRNLWTLWPLILIGIGVGLILSRTRFDFIGGLIVAATLGLMAGGLLSSGVSTISTGGCGSSEGTTPFPARDGTFGGATADVSIELNCGTLDLTAAAGNAWRVEGRDRDGVGPTIDADDASLQVRSRDQDAATFFGERDTWQVTVPGGPTLEIEVKLNAGSSTVDLGGAALATLDVELNAGSAGVDLTEVATIERLEASLNLGSLGITLPNKSMTGSIEANAGSVKLCAPEGAGLRLRTGDSIIASYDYAGRGLVQDGTTWTTPGYDTADVQIDLETRASAGSFSLDPEGGCG